MADEIVVVEHDPGWAGAGTAAAEELIAHTRGLLDPVEHIGSTAVPGLAAKPVIDLLAAIQSIEDIPLVAVTLELLGYEHRPRKEDDGDVAYFRRFGPEGRRTHHVHVVLLPSFRTDPRLAFRDHLRAHPEVAASYGELKQELAARHTTDRVAYTDAKTEFVQSVLSSMPRQ